MVSQPGYGAVPPSDLYANTTISSTSLSSGTGYTYTAGTGVYNPVEAVWSSGASTMTSGKLNLVGDDADLIINGMSLLKVLEERLAMMIPNPELEKEWDELKVIGDQYRKLEADLKEKTKMWKALKKT